MHNLRPRSIATLAILLAVASMSLTTDLATAQTAAQTASPDATQGATLLAAGRILNQTSFGPTASTLSNVESIGVSAYISQQLTQPAYQMASVIPAADYQTGDCNSGWNCMPEAWWWQDVLFGQDQLRQRVAFALSKLFVVSFSGVDGRYYPYYLNALSRDAFGNWQTLMQDVDLSGAMGTYLNMSNSLAQTSGGQADENFARESMQLFSIGTVALNQDGSAKLDSNGNTIPTYTPAIVQAFAKAYTGYTFANADCSAPSAPQYYYWPQPPGQGCAMVPLPGYHDTSAKTLLRGVTLPAGQSAAADVKAAINNLFQDPSLPPFVCRRLIQNLVKSNPSPAYISRVAGVFINNGKGVRGDMVSVIKAILLDSEARAGDTATTPDASSGVLRDPFLWWASALRSLGATQNLPSPDVSVYYAIFDVWLTDLGEAPHTEPSVFSFYSPNNTLPGSSLFAPEFQLENTASISWMILHLQDLVDNHLYLQTANEFSLDLSATSSLGQIASSQGATALVSALNGLLMHGTMSSAMSAAIVNAVNGQEASLMVRNAVFLVLSSPQYRVMV